MCSRADGCCSSPQHDKATNDKAAATAAVETQPTDVAEDAVPIVETHLPDMEDVITIVETPTSTDLERMKTLKELKDMCASRDLSVHGKKSDLAKRIVSSY